MCCCDDAESPEFFRTTEPRARKPYRCCECHRAIAAGERYTCHTGKWDGVIEVFRWCAHCAAGAIIAKDVGACDCYCLGTLWEGIHEGLPLGGEADRVALRLIASARRKWTVRRGARAGQRMPMPEAKPIPVEVRSWQLG